MDKKEAQALLAKYLEGNCTAEESALLESWYLKYQHKDLLEITDAIRAKRLAKIRKSLPVVKSGGHGIPLLRYSVVASLLIVAAIGMYLYPGTSGSGHEPGMVKQVVILAGGNKAILKLGNGKTIDLSGDKAGIVVKSNELTYNDGSVIHNGLPTAGMTYNTISTPKGGQYQVVLADGSKAWLNAESSITYPIKFDGLKRRVEITGEVYFEVNHMKTRPFIVLSRGQLIEVLGTHFNVMAYPEEKITKTTLLAGKVKINRSDKGIADLKSEVILKPGEQSQIFGKNIKVVKPADIEEITAWKNGYFKFGGSLEDIMMKVARWYNVTVIYQNDFGGQLKFLGKVSRSKNLPAILDIIESAGGVHFKVEGRKVIVMK